MRYKLPEWIPEVSRPFNKAWQDTWEAMTPNEKRWSFVVDFVIATVVIIVVIWLVK